HLQHVLDYTLDTLISPVTVTYGTHYAELAQNLHVEGPDRWFRISLDARQMVPHASGRMVFLARLMRAMVFSRGVPFYERPMLGGENTLRGFGRNRFIDDNLFLINLEERIRVFEK